MKFICLNCFCSSQNRGVAKGPIWHGKAIEVNYLFYKCEQKPTVATFKKLQKANGGEREWNKLWEVRDRKKSASTVDRSMWGSYLLDSDGNLHVVTFYDSAAGHPITQDPNRCVRLPHTHYRGAPHWYLTHRAKSRYYAPAKSFFALPIVVLLSLPSTSLEPSSSSLPI